MMRPAHQVTAQRMSLPTARPSPPLPVVRPVRDAERDRSPRSQERLPSNGGSGRSEAATRVLTHRSSLRAPVRSLVAATARRPADKRGRMAGGSADVMRPGAGCSVRGLARRRGDAQMAEGHEVASTRVSTNQPASSAIDRTCHRCGAATPAGACGGCHEHGGRGDGQAELADGASLEPSQAGAGVSQLPITTPAGSVRASRRHEVSGLAGRPACRSLPVAPSHARSVRPDLADRPRTKIKKA